MRVIPAAAALLPLCLLANPLAGQNAECSPYSTTNTTYNVCNAAVDGTRLFHPVLGLLISGGNPVLGSARPLGGFPHLSLTARVNATQVQLPDLSYDGSSSSVPLDDEIVAPAPLVEGALGLWGGLPGGLLSIDALGSAQLLPTDQFDNLRLDSDARTIGSIGLGLGYGARIGVLRGAFPIPAVSVSVMRRDIPRMTYGDLTDATQDYQYSVDLRATNVRVVASERLALLTVGAGLGWDKYTGDAVIAFRDPLTSVPQPPIAIGLDNTRTMAFLNAALSLSVIRIAGKLGYQAGKDQKLPTTFEGVNDAGGRMFGGLGLEFGF